MAKSKKRRGLAPNTTRVTEMERDGYGTPGAVAKRFNLSNKTIYSWIEKDWLEPVGGKPGSKKVGANVWVLFASVERRAGSAAA